MVKFEKKQLQKELKVKLDSYRYEHTLGVMYTSAALAMCYEVDLEQAELAGLLHDCAKCIPHEEKIKLCKKGKIVISEAEHQNPSLLHAKLGAYVAKEEYGIDDQEVLDAIRYHTTGRPEMTLLDKIVYIADYIEPLRDKAPHLAKIRSLAFQNIDEALYLILLDTVEYLEKDSNSMDQMTKEAYEYYKQALRK